MRQRAHRCDAIHVAGNAARLLALAAAALLSVATSPPRYSYPRNYPVWKLDGTTLRAVGCGKVRAWVAKSGKTGMGITVRVEPVADARCTARVTAAHVDIRGRRVDAARLPAPATVEPGAVGHIYVPFAWDNEADWNDGVRKGTVSFSLDLGGSAATWSVPMTHAYAGPHYTVDRYQRDRQGKW